MPQTSSSGMSHRQAATAFHSLIMTFIVCVTATVLSRVFPRVGRGTENKHNMTADGRAVRGADQTPDGPERDAPLFLDDGIAPRQLDMRRWLTNCSLSRANRAARRIALRDAVIQTAQ